MTTITQNGTPRGSVEADLIKVVRTLDQGGPEAIPANLARIWGLLTLSSAMNFHAAEETTLRWLLKNMSGSSPDAERLRRYPVVWNILGVVFARVPLFSLAKSLADRRFMAVLQQTSKELADPDHADDLGQGPHTDVDMVDADAAIEAPHGVKRKRSEPIAFDLEHLRQPHSSLRSAESVIGSLKGLLSRVVGCGATQVHEKMGAEHIKSLFNLPADDALAIVSSLLTVCDSSLSAHQTEAFEDQASWISTITSLWNMHLQDPSDSLLLAGYTSRATCRMLGKLRSVPPKTSTTVDDKVSQAWIKDLERFVTGNVILPSMSSLANKGDLAVIQAAATVTTLDCAVSSPILFDLALRAPRPIGEIVLQKEGDMWTRKVFEVLEAPLRELGLSERNKVLGAMLHSAEEQGCSLPLENLRAICRGYAISPEKTDWRIMSQVAACDTDTFVVSSDGNGLLSDVLELIPTGVQTSAEREDTLEFLVCLVHGFAKARDLSGFILRWFEQLSRHAGKAHGSSLSQNPWFSQEIQNAVVGLTQTALTTKQLSILLDDLVSRREAESADTALVVVLHALAEGMESEDYADAVGSKVLGIVTALDDAAITSMPPLIAAYWWRLLSKSLDWLPPDESLRLWRTSKSSLDRMLQPSARDDPATFETFRYCCMAWSEIDRVGEMGTGAPDAVLSFLDTLFSDLDDNAFAKWWRTAQGEERPPAAKRLQSTIYPDSYLDWTFRSSYDILPLAANATKRFPRFLDDLFRHSVSDSFDEYEGNPLQELSAIVFKCQESSHNPILTGGFIGKTFALLPGHGAEGSGLASRQTISALAVLLATPSDSMKREQRETVMKCLMDHKEKLASLDQPARHALLNLMVKLMRQPTFYQGMKFKDLVELVALTCPTEVREALPNGTARPTELLEEIVQLTMRQMMANTGPREEAYFAETNAVIKGWTKLASVEPHTRLLLLKSIVSVVKEIRSLESHHTSLDVERVREHLSQTLVERFDDLMATPSMKERKDCDFYLLTTAIDAAMVLEEQWHQTSLNGRVSQLWAAADELCSRGHYVGWRLRTYLLDHFGKETQKVDLALLFIDALAVQDGQGDSPRSIIFKMADAATRHLDLGERFKYLHRLISKVEREERPTGLLVAIHRIIERLGTDTMSERGISLELGKAYSKAHSRLSTLLHKMKRPADFFVVAETIHLLLDKGASGMTQWNVEITFSSVATYSSDGSGSVEVTSHPKTYEWLCRLVLVILKRHRLRLEGHFHLLIAVLQALLRSLIRRPFDPSLRSVEGDTTSTSPSYRRWQRQAKLFAQLLTTVCEPTVASVTRSQQNTLDSAKDVAKRSAGLHMYLVLMLYIKLQLEHNVPYALRSALDPGMDSIMNITGPEHRRILNEAMDASGRAIFKEFYSRYRKFGVYTGI